MKDSVSVGRKELLSVLPRLKRLIPKGHCAKRWPVLLNVLIEASLDDVTLTVCEAGIETSVSVDLPAMGLCFFSALVPLAELADFVESSESAVITFTMDPQEGGLEIVLGDVASSLRLKSAALDDFPLIPRNSPKAFEEWVQLGAHAMRDSLAFMLLAASKDETRYNLNGVHLDAGEHECLFVATDGYRVHVDRAFSSLPQPPVLESHTIPTPAVKALIAAIGTKAVAGNVEWGKVDQVEFHAEHAFKFGAWTIAYRSGSYGDYPAWRQVIPRSTTGRYSFEEHEATRALTSQIKAAKRERRTPLIRLEKSAATPSRADKLSIGRMGGAKTLIDCQGDAELKAGFDAIYLRDALKGFAGKRVTLESSDENGTGCMRVRACQFSDRYACVMPWRF